MPFTQVTLRTRERVSQEADLLHQDEDIRIIPDRPGRWDFVDAAHVTRYEWAAGHIGDGTVRAILDAGCGTGYGVAGLARRFPSKAFCGADYSRQAVVHARGKYGDLPNASFEVHDFTGSVTLSKAPFDAALSFDVIEHIPDYDKYVEGIARILKPGGLLLCATPNRSVRWDYSDALNPFHAHEFTCGELEAALAPRFHLEQFLGQHIVNRRKLCYHIAHHSLSSLPERREQQWTIGRRVRRYIDRRVLRLHRYTGSDIGFRPDVETAFGLVVVARRRDEVTAQPHS